MRTHNQFPLPGSLGSYLGWHGPGSLSTIHCLKEAVNTLRPRRNRRYFADDIFKCIFMNENVRISIKISLKFVPKGPINNIPALIQIMAWRRPGDKPLSEQMMVSSLTHICVTWPQWVKLNHSLTPFLGCRNHSMSGTVASRQPPLFSWSKNNLTW